MARKILCAMVALLLWGTTHAQTQAVRGAGLQAHVVPRMASSFGTQHHGPGWAFGLQLEVTSADAGLFVEGNQWLRRDEICLNQPWRFEVLAALLGAWCEPGPPLVRSFEGGLAVHPLPGASHQPFIAVSLGVLQRANDRATQTMMGLRGGVDLPQFSFMRIRLEFTHHRTVPAPLDQQIWFSTLSVGLRFSHRFGLWQDLT